MINDGFFCQVTDAIIQTEPSLLAVIDDAGRIESCCCYLFTSRNVAGFYGKQLQRVLRLLFANDAAVAIMQMYNTVHQTGQQQELPEFKYPGRYGQPCYARIFFIPLSSRVVIYARNITAAVQDEHELREKAKHYERINNELKKAMARLDNYLSEAEYARKRLAALYRITSAVQRGGSTAGMLSEIVAGITREFGFRYVKILFLDRERDAFKILTNVGWQYSPEISLQDSIAGYAVQNREVIYVSDVQLDPRYIRQADGVGSELAIPLIVEEDVIGVLDIQAVEREAISDYDLDVLLNLSSQIAITAAHAMYVALVEHQAVTDALTGLYNYRYFYSRIEQEYKRAERYGRHLSLLMFDIDYFKKYNDTYGHMFGNEILKKVAAIIVANVRDVDTVVRFGGEEFAVLLPETDIDEASEIAERIRIVVADDAVLLKDGQHTGVTVSIGVAASSQAKSFYELIHFADAALYEAKNASRNCVRRYAQG